MNNPFITTFGLVPPNYIERIDETNKIVDNFLSDFPSNFVYLITGLRGSGKTVFMTNIGSIFSLKKDWIVINIGSKSHLLESIASELYHQANLKFKYLKAEFNFSFNGIGLSINGENPFPSIFISIKQMLDAKAVKTNMSIALKLCAQSGIIFGNVSELNQVFQNLTDNALKYGKSGGQVTISCRVFDNKDMPEIKAPMIYAVAVHNTGEPIAAEYLPHLFERFYRVAATKNKAVGTGLGLSIVQQIVKHHNGVIKVQSSNETGTVFTVYLPMYPEESSEETFDSESSEQITPAGSAEP